MKLVSLTKKGNQKLRELLLADYRSDGYIATVTAIADAFQFNLGLGTVTDNLLNTVNSVIVDNLVSFVLNKDPFQMVTGMNYGNIMLKMEFSYRHFRELLGDGFVDLLEAVSEAGSMGEHRRVGLIVTGYMQHLYMVDKASMDEALTQLFELLYFNLEHLSISSYRTVFLPDGTPALLITERTPDENGVAVE